MNAPRSRARRFLHVFQLRLRLSVVSGVSQHGDGSRGRYEFLQQAEPLRFQASRQDVDTGQIAACS